MSRKSDAEAKKIETMKQYVKGKALRLGTERSADIEFIASIVASLDSINKRIGVLEDETNQDNMVDLFGEEHN